MPASDESSPPDDASGAEPVGETRCAKLIVAPKFRGIQVTPATPTAPVFWTSRAESPREFQNGPCATLTPGRFERFNTLRVLTCEGVLKPRRVKTLRAVLKRSACQNAPRRVDSNSFQNGVGRVETKGSARHGARQSEQPAGATLERHPCCLGRRGRASSPGAVGARHVRGGGLAADRVRSRRAHGSLSTVCGTSCADPRAWRPLAFLRSARASAARVQSGCHWHCSNVATTAWRRLRSWCCRASTRRTPPVPAATPASLTPNSFTHAW